MAFPELDWLTPDIEKEQARHMARVAALYAGHEPREVIAIRGLPYGRSYGPAERAPMEMHLQPTKWVESVLADMAESAEQAADPVTFRPLAIPVRPLGVHFIDGLLGAHVYHHEGQVWAEELTGDLADLQMPDLAHSPLLEQAVRLAEVAVEASRGRLLVTMPVLSCPINIGINVYGQRLLEALLSRPNVARRALRIITDVIKTCMHTFQATIPEAIRRTSVAANRYAPPGFGIIDGCATQLVSKVHYDAFFSELDQELLAIPPAGGMIHLCGAHAQHVPTWRSMRALRSVQINDRAVDDVALYHSGLRPDQILYVAPSEAFPIKRILDITGGLRLILQAALPAPIPLG